MRMEYIRRTYGVPAKRGCKVKFTGNPNNFPQFGTVTGTYGKYLKVLMDGEIKPGTYHPEWRMEYLTPDGANSRPA